MVTLELKDKSRCRWLGSQILRAGLKMLEALGLEGRLEITGVTRRGDVTPKIVSICVWGAMQPIVEDHIHSIDGEKFDDVWTAEASKDYYSQWPEV